jgi:dynein light chain 4
MTDAEEGPVQVVAVVEEEDKKVWNYPLIKYSDLPEETKIEILDTCISAVERYVTELDKACQYIKEEMDRLYEGIWHCIIGESFGFEVTYELTNFMYAFHLGNVGILLWRCS